MSKKRGSLSAQPSLETPQSHEGDPLIDVPLLESDRLTGKTLGDIVRQYLVRIAFLNELMGDPRVQVRLQQWGERTGLTNAVQRYAAALDKMAQYQGLENRLDHRVPKTLAISRDCSLEEELALSDVYTAIDRLDDIAEELANFVGDELGCPWTWLAAELLRALYIKFWEYIDPDCQTYADIKLEYPPAPKFNFRFERPAGEDPSKLVEEFLASVEAAIAPILRGEIPRGKVPTNLQEELDKGVGKYARWFFYNKVCGQSIRSHAIAYHETRHRGPLTDSCGCRRAVFGGIKTAANLLNPPQSS
jgi:hypothetical protein